MATVTVKATETRTVHDGRSMIVLTKGKDATVAESSVAFLRDLRLIEGSEAKAAPAATADDGEHPFVTERGGNWFAVQAPWMDEAEKVRGSDEATARAVEIEAAGEPADADTAPT